MIPQAAPDLPRFHPYTQEAVRARADAMAPWHQRIELLPGVFSSDTAHAHDMKPALRKAGVSGASVLDVACNAGLHSLQAFECGAKRVFSFDARQCWTAQADFVRSIYGISDDVWTVRTLDADFCLHKCQPFNVVVAKGILYHVADPFAFLREISRIATRAIVINTERAEGNAPGFSIRLEDKRLAVSGLNSFCWYPTGLDVLRAFFTQPGADSRAAKWKEVDAWQTSTRCQIILKRNPNL
jgi:hypothetical protein